MIDMRAIALGHEPCLRALANLLRAEYEAETYAQRAAGMALDPPGL